MFFLKLLTNPNDRLDMLVLSRVKGQRAVTLAMNGNGQAHFIFIFSFRTRFPYSLKQNRKVWAMRSGSGAEYKNTMSGKMN